MLVDVATVRHALEHDELEACFQPIVELHTGQLAGFEVLARWRAPGVGLVLPPNFISIAEQNGLIGLLMQQVVRKAFMAAPVIPDPLFIAVNISPLQLHDRSLPTQICSLANEAGFSIPRLVIEITESALVDNLDQARQIAGGLKDVGCRLALDDFGTGYSSLRHLQALPFDKLKVDGSFVKSMTKTRESRKIVAAVVGLGHSLGLITVAECIETDEQADMLVSLGCEMGQGWLYGRPVEAIQIPAIIAAAPQELSRRLSKTREGGIVSSLEALPGDRLAQLQAIYDGAPVGLCFLDRNLRYVSLNRRLADLNDAPVAAHLGRTAQQMIPTLFPLIEPYIRRALRGEATNEVEISRPSSDKSAPNFTCVCSYQPAFDEAGEVIGVSVAVMDTTDKKRAEEARRESEENFRSMVDLNPAMPWVMDAEGNNVEVSTRWFRMTGLTPEQTRGFGWLDAVHPDDRESAKIAVQHALATGDEIDIKYRVATVDRGWRWMRSRGSARRDNSGCILRWYGIVEDIHDRQTIRPLLEEFA